MKIQESSNIQKREETLEVEKENKFLNMINKNIFRALANEFKKTKFNVKGLYYVIIHNTIIVLIAGLTLFNTNLIHLSVLLIVVSMDALSIVVLHGCPLTQMEQKYLNNNSSDIRRIALENLNISYSCDHEYEKQVELLINIWCLIAGKILIILLLKTFDIKLLNNNVYSL